MPTEQQIAAHAMRNMIIRHTVVVGSWFSHCGNCSANISPDDDRRCSDCGVTFSFSATEELHPNLGELADYFGAQWPDLEFVGSALSEQPASEADPEWRLCQLWVPRTTL